MMKHTFRTLSLICFFVCIIAGMVIPLFSNESAKPQGQFRAVLIGIDEYKHWQDDENYARLNYCVKDIDAIAKVLEANGYQRKNMRIIKKIATEDDTIHATKARIEDRLKDTLAQCEKDDVILVYFSGHGIYLDGSSYLVPYDGRYVSKEQPPAERQTRLTSLLSMTRIYSLLSSCQAKTKYLITDACQSNVREANRGTDSKVASEFRINAKDVPAGLIQMTSCREGETSSESDAMQHGIFSAVLLEGMQDKADANDDGKITITELYTYISKRVPEEASKKYKK